MPGRAPTPDEGLAPFCRDTFAGTTRLRIWERDVFGMRKPIALVDATSTSAALEVSTCPSGSGPWPASWHLFCVRLLCGEIMRNRPFRTGWSVPGLQVGGGPWWSSWKASAEMKEPLRSFLNLPIDSLLTAIPGGLRPPGL